MCLRRFLADQKIASSWRERQKKKRKKKKRKKKEEEEKKGEKKEEEAFCGTYSTSNKLLLVARHILTTGLQNRP